MEPNTEEQLMTWYIFEILVVILAAGLVGGYAGYLESLFPSTTPPPSPNTTLSDATPTPQPNLKADLIIGVVASACVPALLRLVSSPLANDIFNTAASKGCTSNCPASPEINLLYLAGLCLVAAYASRTFLSNFTNKLLALKVAQLQNSVNRMEARLNAPVP
jgi:hypothetical protein